MQRTCGGQTVSWLAGVGPSVRPFHAMTCNVMRSRDEMMDTTEVMSSSRLTWCRYDLILMTPLPKSRCCKLTSINSSIHVLNKLSKPNLSRPPEQCQFLAWLHFYLQWDLHMFFNMTQCILYLNIWNVPSFILFFFYALMCIPLFGLEAAVINIFVLIMVRIL